MRLPLSARASVRSVLIVVALLGVAGCEPSVIAYNVPSISLVGSSSQATADGVQYTFEIISGVADAGLGTPFLLVASTDYSATITLAPGDVLGAEETGLMVVDIVAAEGTWSGNTLVLPYFGLDQYGYSSGEEKELLIPVAVDLAGGGDTGSEPDTDDTGDTSETPDESDIDGDGLEDGVADKVISSGQYLCFHEDLVDWDGDVFLVGYGFNGPDDWNDLSHETYLDGTEAWYCYELAYTGDVYRVTVRGDGSDEWALLDSFCPYYVGDEPLCWERDDGWSICLDISSDGEIVAGDCSSTG